MSDAAHSPSLPHMSGSLPPVSSTRPTEGGALYDQICQSAKPLRDRLLAHPVYRRIETLADLRIFLEHHVFAVWDFMSLLKSLQRHLSCTDVPWVPQSNGALCRLVNEIVLGEESDEDGRGGFASHFELYLQAMQQCGADTAPALRFIDQLRSGQDLPTALQASQVPQAAQAFVLQTWDVVHSNQPHRVGATFTIGREDLIPDMFRALVEDLRSRLPERVDRLVYYLNRHIELDEDQHGPMARQMLITLCGDEEQRWQQARQAASDCLQARIELWDAVVAAIDASRGTD